MKPLTGTSTSRSAAFQNIDLLLWVVIGIALVAIIVPRIQKARAASLAIRQRTDCKANLKQMDSAIQGWALENKKTSKDTYSLVDTTLLQYLKGTTLPVCPAGGAYKAGKTVADPPICSLSSSQGHSLGPSERFHY